ncbi:MAG: exodeoxyribonuclease VII small subunit [bacterium]|nr:exodeoxyribonuclease VII small subunit [bacterium]
MDEKPTFEEALRKLEKLVGEMEGGTLPLGEMMKRFEEGRKLSAFCTAELESIRQRVEKVVSAPNEPVRVEPLEVSR